MKAVPGKRTALLTVSLILSACGGGGGGGTVPPGTPLVTTTFTTWRTDLASKAFQLDGKGNQVSGILDDSGNFISVEDAVAATASATFIFDKDSNLSGLLLTSTTDTASRTEGFAGITSLATDADFLNATGTASQAIISDPKSLAWDYQSFGVWETGLGTSDRTLHAISVGTPTAGTAIPGTGTANFTGQVVGSYVSAAGQGETIVLADLNVTTDFTNQSLAFSTNNTRTSTEGSSFGPPPVDLTISGTLNYLPGINGFTGTLTTASGLSGNSTGQFYGPAAEELGGAFSLKNASAPLETYSGAYGARDIAVP